MGEDEARKILHRAQRKEPFMSYALALALTVLGMVLMSFESLLIKLTTIPAQSISFYFGLFMFCATHLMLYIKVRNGMVAIYRHEYKAILLSALFMGTSNYFFILAIKNTSVASAVFILSTAPLVSALIGFVLFRTPVPKRLYVASFFVFIGIGLIVYNDWDGGNMKGNLYAFLCVLSFSSLFSVLERYKDASRLACIGAGGLVAALLAFLTVAIVIPDAYSLGIVFFMGFILTPISRVLIGLGTKVLPSVDVTLLTNIETVLAPIWVWLFLAEAIMPTTLIGGAIIIVTLVVYSKISHTRSKR